MEKGTKQTTLILVYEAVTSLTTPIEIDLDADLIGVHKDNISVTGVNVLLNTDLLPTLAWQTDVLIGLSKQFTVTITKVDIPNSTEDLTFTSRVGRVDPNNA